MTEDRGKLRAQILQHTRALVFLLNRVGEDLTEDIVCHTRAILLGGAFDANDDAPIRAGQYRDCPITFTQKLTAFLVVLNRYWTNMQSDEKN